MTYEQALAFWFGRVNFEIRQPTPGDFKLDRMRALLRILGEPQRTLRFIHVAGTNGKGSVCAMIDSICRSAGMKTGLFTSPHLVRFNERIQINGLPIEDAWRPAIAANLRVTLEHAAAVEAFPLPDDAEPSPIFKA